MFKNKFNILVILFLVALASIGVGYSALSTSMSINGSAAFDPVDMIRITTLKTSDLINTIENSKSFSMNELNFLLDINDLDGSATYSVTINNLGQVDKVLTNIDKVLYSNDLIKYEIDGLKINDVIKAKESISFNITFKYKDDVESLVNTRLNTKLKLLFEDYVESGLNILEFDANGGYFINKDISVNTIDYIDNTIVNGEYILPKKDDYHFVSWCTTKDCENGSVIDITNINSDLKLYAKWEYGKARFNYRSLYRVFHDGFGYDENGNYKRLKQIIKAFRKADTVPSWAIDKEWNKNLGRDSSLDYFWLYGETTKVDSFIVPILFWYDKTNYTVYWYSEDSNPVVYYTEQYGSQIGFSEFNSITDISGIENFDISLLDQMDRFFYGCSLLTDLTPIKNFDTSNVTSMYQTFAYDTSLKDSDLEPINDWNISNVVNFKEMFRNTPGRPSFTKVSGTFDKSGAFIPN